MEESIFRMFEPPHCATCNNKKKQQSSKQHDRYFCVCSSIVSSFFSVPDLQSFPDTNGFSGLGSQVLHAFHVL